MMNGVSQGRLPGSCGEFLAKELHMQRLQECKELGMFEELRGGEYSLGEQWGDDKEELGKGSKSTKSNSPC